MRDIKFIICLLVLITIPVQVTALPMFGIEGAVGVWWPTPDGNMRTGADTDRLDLKNDFSFSRETEFSGRLKIDMPLMIPNAYFMANPLKFNERTTNSFEFGGESFSGELNTEMKINQYDLGLYYAVPFLKSATLDKLNVDAGLNFRFIDAEASVSQGSHSESESMNIVIPQVYLGFQFQPVERFSFEAEARGLTYRNDTSYSLLGRVKASAFGPVFVSGGYRYDDYDIDKDGLIINFNFSGPFLETGLSF